LYLQFEISARLYFKKLYELPFFYSRNLFEFFYPEFINVTPTNNRSINILCLGGSVLGATTINNFNFGKKLEDKLNSLESNKSNRSFYNVTNISTSSRTSLDSKYKYEYLINKGQRYDITIFYHGINELRFNNCPDNVWKDDYSHYQFYRDLNIILGFNGFLLQITRIPFFIKHLVNEYYCNYDNPDYGPKDKSMPKPEWLKFGSSIKTSRIFKENLQTIYSLCKSSSSNLIIPIFLSCFPEKYTSKDFLENKYPYQRDGLGFPVDLWGDFKNVEKGLFEHNNVIFSLKKQNDLHILNLTEKMNNHFNFFTDVCHFSKLGYEIFIENISQEIISLQLNHDST